MYLQSGNHLRHFIYQLPEGTKEKSRDVNKKPIHKTQKARSNKMPANFWIRQYKKSLHRNRGNHKKKNNEKPIWQITSFVVNTSGL